MDEFLKINWRLHDLTLLEPHKDFIREDVLAESLVYRGFDDKSLFYKKSPKLRGLFPHVQYVPGPERILTTGRPSLLDEWTHHKCLQALQVIQAGKDPTAYTKSEQFVVGIYNTRKAHILEEQARFQKFACGQWQRHCAKGINPAPQALVNFGKAKWESKWKRLERYPRFYKQVASIKLAFNEEESDVQYQCWTNALDLGCLARFTCPVLKSPLHLRVGTLPPDSGGERFDSNLPVSEDQNIPRILKSHPQVDLVVSCGTLKCIADTSEPTRRWMVPVVVRAVPNQSGGCKNVVFLNKPLAQHEVSHLDLAGISYKTLLKTNLCKYQAFSFAFSESPLKPDKAPSLHHNVCYKIWNIKKTSCQTNLMKGSHKPVELHVLVRAKLDGCEMGSKGTLEPVVLRPKLESLLHYGAQLPTKGELAREWTSLFFVPFSNLYRIRIAPKSGEVIHLEKCSIQKIVAEAQSLYQFKPQLGLGTLQTVFERLVSLKPGNYLLQHLPKHEAFVAVLEEASESDLDTFDLQSERQHLLVTEQSKNWVPLDPNFLLPRFEVANRMPCMFTPKPNTNRSQAQKRKLKK